MRRIRLALLIGALTHLSVPASATTLTLNGVIRDFLPASAGPGTYNGHAGVGHPDFESLTVYSIDTNAVLATLGADGKPVFDPSNAGSPYVSTTTAGNFNQWYNDTPGVNLSMAFDITLDDTASPGLFTYSNTAFFPIDGQLYGNNPGQTHNYGFTYEIHTSFGYQSGQIFSFTGDDDLWVFINGQRVINLGGVHPAATDTLLLDDVLLNGMPLTPGQNYSMAIFFAERHTGESRFTIQTTIPFVSSTETAADISAPEPASLMLLGSGLVGLAAAARRRRKQAARR